MDSSAHGFSLSKYARYAVAVVIVTAILAVAVSLSIIHKQHRAHDVEITELLALKNAQTLSQHLTVGQQSVDADALQRAMQLFADDGHVVVTDSSGRIVAQSRDIDSDKNLVHAEASVAGTDWRLQVSRPASGDILVYFFEGTPIWMALFVAAALAALGARVLQTIATELKNISRFLRQIGSGPFSVDPPPCEIEETAQLLPAIQRIASDLHKKEQAIAKLSFTDNVTKLPNRLHFLDRFRHAFELARRGNDIRLLILEINEFQKADEVLGHESADAILRLLADTLHNQTRKSDFAARLGVSSFAAIFYNAQSDMMPGRVRQLQQDFATRQRDSAATNGEVYCTLSCAVTVVDAENDTRAEDPIARVENALRRVKKLGGDQIAVVELAAKSDEPPAALASG